VIGGVDQIAFPQSTKQAYYRCPVLDPRWLLFPSILPYQGYQGGQTYTFNGHLMSFGTESWSRSKKGDPPQLPFIMHSLPTPTRSIKAPEAPKKVATKATSTTTTSESKQAEISSTTRFIIDPLTGLPQPPVIPMTWKTIAEVSLANDDRTICCSAILNGRLYVIGTSHKDNPKLGSTFNTRMWAAVWQPSSDIGVKLLDQPDFKSAAADTSELKNAIEAANIASLTSMHQTAGTWAELPPPLTMRHHGSLIGVPGSSSSSSSSTEATTTTNGGYLLLCGGRASNTYQTHADTTMATCERYDPHSNTWSIIPDSLLPHPREYGQLVLIPNEGVIMIFGRSWGKRRFRSLVYDAYASCSSIDYYSLSNGQWSTLPQDSQRLGSDSTSTNWGVGCVYTNDGLLHLIGGCFANDRKEVRDECWSLDIHDPTAKWRPTPSIPRSLAHCGVAII
jgi:hypothetical protein